MLYSFEYPMPWEGLEVSFNPVVVSAIYIADGVFEIEVKEPDRLDQSNG